MQNHTLVFLDCCHEHVMRDPSDTSYGGEWTSLAPAQVPPRCFVAYSASPGGVALDGQPGELGPFARAFIKHISTYDLNLDELMARISKDVELETGGRQAPWTINTLPVAFYFSRADASISEQRIEREPAEISSPQPVEITPTDPVGVGQSVQLSRDVSDTDLRLNFADYAAAFARVFREGRGEFCAALFGRWGSGKTRLARHIEKFLTDPSSFLEYHQLSRSKNPETDGITYDVVWFSAWQYRRVPEAWIYLYETFAKAAVRSDNPLSTRAAQILRTNIAKKGELDLALKLSGLALLLSPLSFFTSIGAILIPLIGAFGVFQALLLLRRGPKGSQKLQLNMQQLLVTEKSLGFKPLLELIFVHSSPVGYPKVTTPSSSYTKMDLPGVLWVVLVSTFLLWGLGLNMGLGAIIPFDIPFTKPDKTPIVGYCVLSLWTALTFATIYLLYWVKEKTNRILLIIDDLDRCALSEMIEISRSDQAFARAGRGLQSCASFDVSRRARFALSHF